MQDSLVIITTDETKEMIKIEKDGKEVFYGNETDFNRDAYSFRILFKKLGIKCKVVKKPYENWEQ